eukprot:5565311-Pyramimonas_sp.AAC.1
MRKLSKVVCTELVLWWGSDHSGSLGDELFCFCNYTRVCSTTARAGSPPACCSAVGCRYTLRSDVAAADDDEVLLTPAHEQLPLVEETKVARPQVLPSQHHITTPHHNTPSHSITTLHHNTPSQHPFTLHHKTLSQHPVTLHHNTTSQHPVTTPRHNTPSQHPITTLHHNTPSLSP